MAEIIPIAAWRYNHQLAKNINELTSPLFDVVSPKQREALYLQTYNSIHLSVPGGKKPSEEAKKKLDQWKKDGIILQDSLPGIYVYYQHFSLAGSDKAYCRKGFISNIRIYDWDENVIKRHESTMPASVNDRLDLLHATQLNVSPTHGLYTDPTKEIEQYMDEAMLNPIYETEDYQGVRDVLAVIHDRKVIKRIQQIIAEKQIILADGHHRYEGSLQYMKQRRASNEAHTGLEGYNYHMMFLTNTESDDLRILPTHRVVSSLNDFDPQKLLKALEEDFIIKHIENAPDVYEIILGKQWAFGLLMGDEAYKIRLKPEKIAEITWNFPQPIKELDLTVMHYFVFEKVLGIPGKDQTRTPHISFQRNFTECLREVLKGEAQFALITKDISIETVKQVCYSGYTMPQKSTYFYPKVICGFLFSSIDDDEFNGPFSSSFR